MSRPSRQFKDTQVFGWEHEPKDERPSEFVPSTGYSSLSGYYTMPDSSPLELRRYRPRRKASAFNGVLIAALAAIGLGTAGLIGLLHWLRG
jgi:hypothetical protein